MMNLIIIIIYKFYISPCIFCKEIAQRCNLQIYDDENDEADDAYDDAD